MSRHVVILGNGIAGITAARHIRKQSDARITVVSGETDHFFSRTALMYIYMGHMTFEDTKPYDDGFWARNRIELRRAWVEKVDVSGKRLLLDGGGEIAWDVLILATGSESNRFGWPGQDLPGVQGLYSRQDLELLERNTSNIERGVIVGGGLIGVETAEMLVSRGIGVTFLAREKRWMNFAFPLEESTMIGEHILAHGVDLRLGAELDRIVAGEGGRARGIVTKDGHEIECGIVALTVGVRPNIGFLAGSAVECDAGILVDRHLRTSADDVYAIGDCAQLREPQPGRRAVEPVWYAGRRMGQTVARTVCDHPTEYDQGIWFNSAKFFDLEWQVYGNVPAQTPEGHDTLFWKHRDGRKSIRINHRRGDGAVTGFNVIGVRYRQEVCETWIAEGRPLRDVLPRLGAANFDPELAPEHEGELIEIYNRAHPAQPVSLEQRRGLRGLFARRRVS